MYAPRASMSDPSKPVSLAQKWAFALVPVVAIAELGSHVVQTHSAPTEGDWQAARAYVAAHAKAEDLVAFAPKWVDPEGREYFGNDLATLEREARPDESRFAHAFEVSIRGAHLPAFTGWRRTGEERFGRVSVTMWDNPAPVHVLQDLVSMVDPAHLAVSRGDQDRETACSFTRASPQSGGLGFGPGIPANRFVCPGGGVVGASVIADLDYVPRRCIYAPPSAGGVTRLRFRDVRFGRALHGYHALYVEAERDAKRPPVTIKFKVDDSVLGVTVHKDGDGWRSFEFDTSALDGQQKDLVAEISSPSSDRRMYCFEADTR